MSTVDETVRLLAATEVFGEVEARELAEVAQVAVPRHWDRGEVIFREGDVGDTCYLLRSGAILLTREHQDGRMVALAELRAGMLFGELAMFRGERRSAPAGVTEPASALALLATDMQRLVRRNPDLALKLLASLAERVSRTNERLLQQSFQTVAGRVASALLAQTKTRQADGAPDADVLIRSTQAEIAHLAGTSRESASRFLATLERAGVVTLGRGKVTVHDPGRLRNYITDARARMVERQLRRRGIDDVRVLTAMSEVPRELFVPPEQRRRAYRDGALRIAEGQTISQPWIVAFMAQLLELRGDETVLEVGTGSGYAAAVLSRLCAEVLTMERYASLAES